MIIDDKRLFTPHRACTNSLKYTDHVSLHVKFKGIPEVKKGYQMDGKHVSWNTKKVSGWENYKDLTTENEKLVDLIEEAENFDSDKLMNKIVTTMNKVKFQCFGKVKISNQAKRDKELEELYNIKSKAVMENNELEIINIDKKISEELVERQRNEFEKKLAYLNDLKKEKGSSAALYNLKEKILGSKKCSQEAVSMEDPETGSMIVEKSKLKEASISYVAKLLTNREPKEEYKAEFEIMENLHDIRRLESDNNEEFTESDFEDLIKQLEKKNKSKYQFILKAGKLYHRILFLLFKVEVEENCLSSALQG